MHCDTVSHISTWSRIASTHAAAVVCADGRPDVDSVNGPVASLHNRAQTSAVAACHWLLRSNAGKVYGSELMAAELQYAVMLSSAKVASALAHTAAL